MHDILLHYGISWQITWSFGKLNSVVFNNMYSLKNTIWYVTTAAAATATTTTSTSITTTSTTTPTPTATPTPIPAPTATATASNLFWHTFTKTLCLWCGLGCLHVQHEATTHYTTLLYNTARVQLPLRTINVSALHNPFYSSPFHYIPWHWTALHYINCITYHCVTWQWFCITLHCVESHYIALHLYIHYIRYIAYVYICFDTGFFQKNSHPPTCCHITPDPPAPPWSMLLPNACRHPNRNGCFFWRPFEAKRCNNIELRERGHASFFAMSLTGWLFFLKNPDSVRERFFGLRMCKYKLEPIPFRICQNLNPSTLAASKLLPTNKDATDLFFSFMDVQTQAWTNSLLHVPKLQSKDTFIFTAATHKQRMCLHASRRRIAQTVFCTVHVQCTHSARYSARHSARPQNAVNTMGLAFCWQFTKNYKNIFFFLCFLIIFWENTWYLQRFVAVHCDVHCSVHCTCTVRALCKTRCLCPLIFSSAERCNSASGGVQAHFTLVHHARHTTLISNFCPHAEQMLQCCFFVCG